MVTECTQTSFGFHRHFGREVVARFDGGDITTEAGGLLLREVEQRIGLIRQLTACFRDYRRPEKIEHSVGELLAQRVYGVALGYEDLNDHDQLRQDPMVALLAGKTDPKGMGRRRKRDQGKAGAGKSTLNRLELTPAEADHQARYKKIVMNPEAIDRLLVDLFLQAHSQAPSPLVLDLDATDDPLHGQQEGRFFHGYYGQYCYLPLYIFCGEFLLGARLRPSNIDASAGALAEVERIVAQIRGQWPQVQIVLRADSGFCRDEIMSWCEQQKVDYVFGLAKNKRLQKIIGAELHQAQQQFQQSGKAARVFGQFQYRTRKSWQRARRVVAKAEHLEKGANPRFVVTSLSAQQSDARSLYEDLYCARGEMENRIKEQQLALFADRTSTHFLRSNQLRLYFSSCAYGLIQALRRLALPGTEMSKAQCHTIRLKLLKLGAQIRITARKIWVLASGHPSAGIFAQAYANLQRRMPLRC
ncbi:MAG TPA: IS1380 family transposase [Nitrososphaerales archaeon]|nr:IS1380 family transposase [Nitrososphaerales archaeon]